jgi:hypothetical protein
MAVPKTDPNGILNLRQAASSASKRDGKPTASTPVVKAIRAAVDEVAKDQVPQLKELDELYAQQIKDLQQIKE